MNVESKKEIIEAAVSAIAPIGTSKRCWRKFSKKWGGSAALFLEMLPAEHVEIHRSGSHKISPEAWHSWMIASCEMIKRGGKASHGLEPDHEEAYHEKNVWFA